MGKQCSAAVLKANRILGMIKHKFTDRSPDTIMALYKSLVRPHLEYCCQMWNPHFSKDIKLIEGVRDVNETLGSETETRPRRLIFSPRRDRD